jgi:hypothetical protein
MRPSDTCRLLFGAFLLASIASGQVKTTLYTSPEGCFKTYILATGRVLTPRGLVEDPTVNAIMRDAVSAQMNALKITQAEKAEAQMEVRFLGGAGADLQVDSPTMGDYMTWDIGGPASVPGRAYKKSHLVIGVFDLKSNQTVWAAQCTDKFGDPNEIRERLQKAVAKAFAKFPKKLVCGT